VTAVALRLATLASCVAAWLVLVVFVPSLQAPFLVPKFAALEVMASLGLLAFALRRAVTGRPRWTAATAWGAVLVLVTTAVAWAAAAGEPGGAPYGFAAMARWAALFGLASGVSVLDDAPDERRRLFETITLAAAAVAVMGLLQHLDLLPFSIPVISKPGSTFGNRNGAAEAMAMALPFGVASAEGAPPGVVRRATFAAIAIEVVFLAVTRTRGAWLGGACGLVTAVLLVRPRASRASVAIVIAAIASACVAASLPGRSNPRDIGDHKRYAGIVEVLEDGFDAHSTALKTRFGLWRRTWTMVREHPIVGVGPGNWPVMFPRYAEPGATRDGVLSASLAPRQAHNDILERTAESGILGLAALGLLAAGATMAVRRRLQTGDADTRTTAAAAGGALVALVALSAASFPLEMPAPIALAGVALGLVVVDTRGSQRPAAVPLPENADARATKRAIDGATIAVGLALISCAVVRGERSVRSSWWLASAERAMHRDHGSPGADAEALEALRRSLDAQPDDYRALLRMAQVLLRQHRSTESAFAARRALDLELYAPNAWAALAAAELDAGAYERARNDATEALTVLEDYPFALQIRAIAAGKLGDELAAQADRSRLGALAASPDNYDTTRDARALLKPVN
jgi:O-antigen ligase